VRLRLVSLLLPWGLRSSSGRLPYLFLVSQSNP
jgi:hypothetical protein